ncbi:hypothetical protein IY145_10620 [Methylosinus sp. H3A]|uniref:hypothetical protein n=1 Tax=Methylosinus sp. H3A TaxID=2785786 RepID=UPI0018C2D856|nr:hypothetical protein [Methylosinus sp. H3A]MBG0809832.1 hypothetical protein [Methylosinus sp. H3A]
MFLERLLALATGAFVAICLGLGLAMMAFGPGRKIAEPAQEAPLAEAAPAPVDPRMSTRARIEQAIAAAEEYRAFFERLRQAFPADYAAAIDAFVAERRVGDVETTSVDFYLAESVRRLRQARGVLAAKAEPIVLARVFDLQLDVLRAISAENKKLCAAFLYGGVDQDFHSFAARRRALVAEMAVVGLEAIASGQAKQLERSAPSEEDFRALEKALASRGLRKPEIDSLLDGKTPEPPFDDKKTCALGQTYLEALRALPEPIRLRIYGLAVELMARS